MFVRNGKGVNYIKTSDFMLAVMTLSASHLIYRLNDTVQIIKIKEYLLIYANFT